MILLKRKPLCTTVLWCFGENLFLSPYSTSTPLSKLYCKHMQGKMPFCCECNGKTTQLFMFKNVFSSLSACILAGQHCPKYTLRNIIDILCFWKKTIIFSRNDALMMIDDMIDSTHLTKFAGTFAAGRYINEDIADAGIEL